MTVIDINEIRRNNIKSLVIKEGLSITGLAKKIGIFPSNISRALSRNGKVSENLASKIENTFQLKYGALSRATINSNGTTHYIKCFNIEQDHIGNETLVPSDTIGTYNELEGFSFDFNIDNTLFELSPKSNQNLKSIKYILKNGERAISLIFNSDERTLEDKGVYLLKHHTYIILGEYNQETDMFNSIDPTIYKNVINSQEVHKLGKLFFTRTIKEF